MNILPGYERLAEVLQNALDQAQSGKGKERHACGELFEQQEICQNTRAVGFGYPLGQARKKAKEAKRLLETRGKDAAIAECLGAINYLAAAVIVMDESEGLKLGDHSERTAAEDVERTLRWRQGRLSLAYLVDWGKAPDEAKWATQNDDGTIGFFADEPRREHVPAVGGHCWFSKKGFVCTMRLDVLAHDRQTPLRRPVPDHTCTQEEDDAFEMMAVRQEWESKPSDVPG
jgi:hypothetical protein